MRKIAAFFAVSTLAVSLGSCTTSPTGVPTIDPQGLANVEVQIQQATANLCKFVPAVTSVAAVIATYVQAGAVIDLINQAAAQICSAVVAVPTVPATMNGMRVRKLSEAAVVNGVAVHGYFIQ
jgi:hypothetical protein